MLISNREEAEPTLPHTHLSVMLKLINNNLRRLCSHLRWPKRRRSKPKQIINRFGIKPIAKPQPEPTTTEPANPKKTIRIATFNAALFSMAPAVPLTDVDEAATLNDKTNDRPRSILKQCSPLQNKNSLNDKSKLRVSINLPDNEISLLRNRQRSLSFSEEEKEGGWWRQRRRAVVEVLRELNADVLGLQDVKAEEENGMKPLSDLAGALGMHYVFAESWAPQYGNAVFSKWPIKRCTVQKVFDHTDFRFF